MEGREAGGHGREVISVWSQARKEWEKKEEEEEEARDPPSPRAPLLPLAPPPPRAVLETQVWLLTSQTYVTN